MNHGLVFVKPTKEDYKQHGRVHLGGVALRPTGQWDAFVPTDEVQNLAMEPYACTSFGTLNCVEALMQMEFGVIINWSDRFLANISGTQEGGNDPHKVAETLRKEGTCYEEEWPYTKDIDTWAKFYATPPYRLNVEAQVRFRGAYDFAHQWVGTDPQSMMNALAYSPLGVDVYAWSMGDNGYYVRPPGTRSGHWCMVYGYEKGKYWKVFDSYSNTRKKLAWNFGFSMVKQYTLHKHVVTSSLWDIAVKWLRDNWL
jgi:hypothetical protein